MKITKQDIKKLILEEMGKQQGAPADKKAAVTLEKTKAQLMKLMQNFGKGVQTNELATLQFLVELIQLVQDKNVVQAQFQRILQLLRKEAEKVE